MLKKQLKKYKEKKAKFLKRELELKKQNLLKLEKKKQIQQKHQKKIKSKDLFDKYFLHQQTFVSKRN